MNNLVIEIKHVVTLDSTLLALLQNFMNVKKVELSDDQVLKVTKADIKEVITIEQLRAELSEISKGNDGKTKVKELLKEFGVIKLTDIKAEDYENLMKKIKEMK